MEAEFPDQILRADHHYQDPLAMSWVLSRRVFYGVVGQPVVFFDGGGRVDGAVSCEVATTDYRSRIQSRLASTSSLSPISISGQYGIEDPSIAGHVGFILVDDVTLGSPRAHVLVLEDHVLEGGTTYHHVTRAAVEEDVVLSGQGAEAIVPFAFEIDPTWASENLRVIAFLQDAGGTREIYQAAPLAGSSDAPEVLPSASLSAIRAVAPNPFRPQRGTGRIAIRVHFSEAASRASATLDVLDAQGRRVRAIFSGQRPAGTVTAAWDGRDDRGRTVGGGVYFVRLSAADAGDRMGVIVLE